MENDSTEVLMDSESDSSPVTAVKRSNRPRVLSVLDSSIEEDASSHNDQHTRESSSNNEDTPLVFTHRRRQALRVLSNSEDDEKPLLQGSGNEDFESTVESLEEEEEKSEIYPSELDESSHTQTSDDHSSTDEESTAQHDPEPVKSSSKSHDTPSVSTHKESAGSKRDTAFSVIQQRAGQRQVSSESDDATSHAKSEIIASSTSESDVSVVAIEDTSVEEESVVDDSLVDDETYKILTKVSPKTEPSELPKSTIAPGPIKNEVEVVMPTSSAQQSSSTSLPTIAISSPKPGTSHEAEKINCTLAEKLKLQDDFTKIRAQIEIQRKMIRQVESGALVLPDNGKKANDKLQALQRQSQVLEERLKKMVVQESVEGAQANSVVDWDEFKILAKGVQPHHYGEQAMQTYQLDKARTMSALKKLHNSLKAMPDATKTLQGPNLLRTGLLPHQTQALAWLVWRESFAPYSGILGDDMGLGKTLSMISLILHQKIHKHEAESDESATDSDDDGTYRRNNNLERGGTLIVAPASVFKQWEVEVKKHCARGALKVVLHHGNGRENVPRRLARADLVITTYGLSGDEVLKKIKWERVILDEAHTIRNHKTTNCENVTAYKAKHRWCLTGTPIQNKEEDFYGLLKFLHLKPFNDLRMFKLWLSSKQSGGVERMALVVKGTVLRRTKKELIESGTSNLHLPEKNFVEINVTFSDGEEKIYQKVLAFSNTLFMQYLHQEAEKRQDIFNAGRFQAGPQNDEYYKLHLKCKAALHKTNDTKINQVQLLVLILRLRQICCHPHLIQKMIAGAEVEVDPEDLGDENLDESINILNQLENLTLNDGEGEPEEAPAEQGASLAESVAKVMSSNRPEFQINFVSAKVNAVMDILHKEVFPRKDKVIIVTQWTSFVDLLANRLSDEGIRYLEISGRVEVKERQGIVDEFNNPNNTKRSVLFLSLTAGGVGLNLIGGNHLIMTDIHWNPMLEKQAQDRIYRFGQTKTVFIYRIIIERSIEERIRALQEKKKAISEQVLTGVKSKNVNKLTLDDMKSLFAIDKDPPAALGTRDNKQNRQ